MICKECDNLANSVEYYDAKTIKRFVCQDHTFSFGPYTLFISISEYARMTNHIPEDKYNEIISLIPIVCIDVAIVYDGKILLIKRRDEPAEGEWWLPGGRLYKGETLEACALRKAKEETGLECELGPMIHYASTDFGTVHSVNFVYLLFASNNKVKLDDTCLDYEWARNFEIEVEFDLLVSPIVSQDYCRIYFDNDTEIEKKHLYIRQCLSKAFDCLQVGLSAYE